MDTAERKQVRLIVEHLSIEAEDSFRSQISILYAQNSAKGLLRSGNTIREAIEIMDRLTSQLIKEAVDQVSAVAMDIDAYAMVTETVALFTGMLKQAIDGIVIVAGGDVRGSSVSVATNKLFGENQNRWQRQLELHRFTFTRTAPSARRNLIGPHIKDVAVKPIKKGGRPPAEFWDDMWAAIAVQLFDGTIRPKTQADVERAMSDWITGNGHDAAASTVRGRARRLWDAIQASGD